MKTESIQLVMDTRNFPRDTGVSIALVARLLLPPGASIA